MLKITLPDDSVKTFESNPTIMQIAESIGSGLAKATLAGQVDSVLVDACVNVEKDSKVKILTADSKEGLDIIRHSCAHLLGHAVKQLFPQAQMAIGPVVENGFYYDIKCSQIFSEKEMMMIEERMHELVKTDYAIVREVVSREKAIEVFKNRDEPYKVEIAKQIPDDEIIALYHHQEYIDMCRGPHVPNTRHLRAFKLTHVAGAYWRGDSNNEMLQRIYGTAWDSAKNLSKHLELLEEAKKRDHRKLGKQMDLFHFQQEAPGMVFWHEKGWKLYQIIEEYIRATLNDDYYEVHTPQMIDKSLWERSGHWDKFGDMIFTTESEKRSYAIKPMNCPAHVEIYRQELKSYRDLPYRISEFGIVHRNEPSGTLHGLMRARRFTQDDAHIFCTEKQLHTEVSKLIDLVFKVYDDFGFNDVIIALSTRPEQRVGDDALWDKSEKILEEVLKDAGLEFSIQPGEGAFYGPKIEFTLQDSLHRKWQCGTIQLDFSMPERLDAQYIDESGVKKTPVMIHRAILGSLERFIGILIEHYSGRFPLWLSPIQIAVSNITDNQAEYVLSVVEKLQQNGIRTISDLRNEKIGYKIRNQTLQHIPYMLIVGEDERNDNTVAVRSLAGKDLGKMSLDKFIEYIQTKMPEGKGVVKSH